MKNFLNELRSLFTCQKMVGYLSGIRTRRRQQWHVWAWQRRQNIKEE
ncbi:hypothetical protein SLEP1_g4413 [Rubroshorea leprosula]|uniref:Uncharacterized protein n=1 Tax=Rubroshorea leprosula TaxID=152421 RepID=A0AAV5HXG2_9ROSI|nr:hypothetical protein SLEP1_g4413 [Rubroshorea leprosula]